PDPSSQKASTIGGNVGENSGGPHTLIYGVTTNHTLGLEIVTPDGEIVHTGGKALDAPGYDLTGLFCGSEGTMGIVTKVIAKLSPLTEEVKTLLGVFETVDQASQAVSDIIASGVIPAALEMMDALAIQAVEQATRAGYPRCCAASTRCRGAPDCGSRTSSTPATATCTRSASSTATSQARSSWRARSAPRC